MKTNPILLKKSISITKQFFINYSLLFIILLVVGTFTLLANYVYVETVYEDLDQDFLQGVYEDAKKDGMKEAFTKNELPDHAYLELVSTGYEVTDQFNSPHKIGFAYGLEEFLKHTDTYETDLFIPEKGDEYLLLYFPADDYFQLDDVFFFTIIFFMVCLISILYWYVKRTSVQLIQPIQKLLKGIDSISAGNYGEKIEFEANQELNELKQKINQMAETIGTEISLKERSEQLRKQLILDISHDLKTPLTNIQGYAETLNSFTHLSREDQQKYTDIIISNSQRANRLIHDLFDLSHMDVDCGSVCRKEQDMAEWLRTLLSSYVEEFEEKGMEYEFDITEAPMIVKFDPSKLERAMTNILQNAMAYSDGYLSVSFWEKQNEAVMIIEDLGTGIPPDYHEKIFEPFVRMDASRNGETGGTGLGLAIAKKIIEQNGGTIELDGEYEKGCRFVVRFRKHEDGSVASF
ncbi:HAMP domain-containing sensor histidine kinase [Rossellomorea sp. YZS02]|uniref:HAMP domain-containing sensor histidine kinase n=1 Tax=Rossellomorea sp. YZS02 TaxID=3097358 RepID=UPI002A0EACC2|nr:HAMP domain-containing sensor histidine kinase [Rossellomorea sp. YZS02]MDX8342610.1 HAMP domain-containing sensor histidine kinase [Rossellomorea sp. YZS02]